MSYPSHDIAVAFDVAPIERLRKFLTSLEGAAPAAAAIRALTPDASARTYFRIPWSDAQSSTAIAAVYPEPFDPSTQPFLDVTRLFVEAGLPVPQILHISGSTGIIVQEDFGDLQLRDKLATCTVEERDIYVERAIHLIAVIQRATSKAVELNSVAAKSAFDEAKLSWELNYFFEHYFHSLRNEQLPATTQAKLKLELQQVARELAAQPRILCHRDFHTSNLMVDQTDKLRIVDYQDARMGPLSYDLVSLLLDRQPAPLSFAEVRERRMFFLEERHRLGLAAVLPEEFAQEFRLMTVQRCLKAVGTFSYQTAIGKRGIVYAKFINPMLAMVVEAATWLNRFPHLRQIIEARMHEPIQ